ncbi:MAG: hypothetical protein U5Q16_08280 [Gammaproteobacteria bacterium]|nr:hypothetical protein [Gammaproteobacteria bacterium]
MAGGRGKQRQLGLPDLTGRIPPKSARPLPAGQPAPGGTGEWYAVTDDGGSALRIRSGLHIGETERGALVFNDGLPERRWIVLRITADGACVAEAADEIHRLVDEAGDTHSRCALRPGATLVFPGNTLRISEHIARPAQPGPRLTVASGLQPVEAGLKPVEAPRELVEAGVTPAAASATEPSDSGEIARAESGTGGESEAPLTEAQPLRSEAQPASAQAGRRSRWKVGAAIAAGGLLVGVLLSWQALWDLSTSPGTATVAEDDKAPVGAGDVPIQAGETPVQAVQIPPLPRRSVALPLTPIDLGDLPPRRLLPAPAVPTDSAPAFAAELARARELLEAGYITYPPEDNAVAVLSRIITRQPDHPEALALLGECTTRLIDAAIEAREQGMQYQARNLLEEVRGFNPDNERANRLWQEWVR